MRCGSRGEVGVTVDETRRDGMTWQLNDVAPVGPFHLFVDGHDPAVGDQDLQIAGLLRDAIPHLCSSDHDRRHIQASPSVDDGLRIGPLTRDDSVSSTPFRPCWQGAGIELFHERVFHSPPRISRWFATRRAATALAGEGLLRRPHPAQGSRGRRDRGLMGVLLTTRTCGSGSSLAERP
jgi:hypothetical protein